MKTPSPIRSDLILRALARRHTKDVFVTEIKTGPTLGVTAGNLFRIDALAIKPSWTHPDFVGYEVKVSRQDFIADTKWDAYLNYCHRFYFACPANLIARDEVPDPAGLIWVYPETLQTRVLKAARHRPVEIPWEFLYHIVISRLTPDRHPFFSSQREMLEAWVQDKKARLDLAFRVRSKMMERIRACEEKSQQAEFILEEYRKLKRAFQQLQEILRAYGVFWFSLKEDGLDDWTLEEIKKALQTGASTQAKQLVREAKAKLELAERLMFGDPLEQTSAG